MRVPGKFVLAALLSSGILVMISAPLIVLCSTALAFRYDCYAGTLSMMSGSQYLLTMIFKLYIQDDKCTNSLNMENLTKSQTVFVLICLTLSFSIANIFAAMALTITTLKKDATKYLDFMTYSYVGLCVASFVVDLTLAINFGMDYSTLKSKLDDTVAGLSSNYELDILRLGALFLMVLSMKGFMAHGVNGVLLFMMIIYLREYQARLMRNEHSIHSRGVLNAYEHSRRDEDIWHEDWLAGFGRDFNVTQDVIHSEDHFRLPVQANPNLKSSHVVPQCWHNTPSGILTRPHSYIEDSGRFLSPEHCSTSQEPVWRRREPVPVPRPLPSLPRPDYEHEPQRLKSAMKTVYI